MRIINLKTMASDEISCPSVVALGTFDGCHMAHKEVLKNAFLLARKNGTASVAYTFDSVPKAKNGDTGAIYTIEEKTLEATSICAYRLEYISRERINEEWKKILTAPFCSKAIVTMKKYGITDLNDIIGGAH